MMSEQFSIAEFGLNIILLLLFYCLLSFAYRTIWPFINFLKYQILRKKLPPGPVGFPIVGAATFFELEPHKTLFHMRKKYGDIIGFYVGNRYSVVLNEFTVAKEVYAHPGSLGRSTEVFDHIPHIGFLGENGKVWNEQRRFFVSVSRDLGIGKKTWEDMALEEAKNYVEFLRETNGEPLDTEDSLRESMVSNILYFTTGRKLDRQKDADKIHMITEMLRVIFTINIFNSLARFVPGVYKLLKILKVGDYGKIVGKVEKGSKFFRNEILGYHNAKFRNVQSYLSSYMEELKKLRESGNYKHFFSEDMLEGNMMTILTATIDTTTVSLYWLIRLMSGHKDVQARVYNELKEVEGRTGRPVSYDERQDIPYTFAVLMEAQRYSSIAPLPVPRKVSEDIQVRGFTIPKGADLILNMWALHNDPQYWDEPEKFKPDRFLTENGTKLINNVQSFLPFSTGRRKCPGETIAWRTILAYFSEIIKNFEISTVPGEETEYKVRNGLVTSLEPQRLCFRARKE